MAGASGDPQDAIGPRGRGGRVLGGMSAIVVNAEYRVEIVRRWLYGVLFADGSNVWAKVSDTDPTDLRHSVGFGVQFLTVTFGVIHFDWAYGLDRRDVDGHPASWMFHGWIWPHFF